MKKSLIKIILPSFFFMMTDQAWATDTIQFDFKKETHHLVYANCSNFSYSGQMQPLDYSYTIRPGLFTSNPRELKYTCSIRLSGFSAQEAAIIWPSTFDLSKSDSEVQLTIHSIDRKTRCGWQLKRQPQVLVVFSLSVDQKLIANKKSLCFFDD